MCYVLRAEGQNATTQSNIHDLRGTMNGTPPIRPDRKLTRHFKRCGLHDLHLGVLILSLLFLEFLHCVSKTTLETAQKGF